ncbi:MAG: hypothetical protein JKX85_07310 [Phycisphaeraceae bacterium]|nr:hypothetical protein [Phycisphaeraceae bacterium]
MSTFMEDLSTEEQSRMEGALRRYGLNSKDHLCGGLNVPKHAEVTVTRHTNDNGFHCNILTKDADHAKKLIGVPDAAYTDDSPYTQPLPAKGNKTLTSADFRPQKHLDELRHIANTYIWGPSHEVAEYKSLIEEHTGQLDLSMHVYTTLDIRGKLSFPGEQAVSILAHTINFYPGGYNDVVGAHLIVNAQIINHKT